MKKLNEKYFCIYGGGSIRGMAYIGAIKAMEELGIKRIGFAGSSVGSIFATLEALEYTHEEIEQILIGVNYELFKDINFAISWEIALSKGEIFYNWIKELIEKKFYGENYNSNGNPPVCFKDLDKDLIIITSSLEKAEYNEFSRYTQPDFEIAKAIRISASMPGLMKALKIDGEMLVDGDFLKPVSMWQLSSVMCPENMRVLEFRLEGTIQISQIKTTIDFLNALISNISKFATQNIEKIHKDKDKFDYIVLETKDVSLMDFNLSKEKRQSLIQLGYDKTIEYFTQNLVTKKEMLLPHYKNFYRYIIKIQEKIQKNKLQNLKQTIGELYIDLADYRHFIDKTYYDLIIEFKNCLYANLSQNILGFYKLENKEFLNAQLNYLASEIWKKIKEIEEYKIKIEEINA
ncbi:patatin-like phospholipase family protein [bacterium]|nr:patatin-like phospholipase family protein [bacterium]